jgi:hypothetical protein
MTEDWQITVVALIVAMIPGAIYLLEELVVRLAGQ